METLQQAVGLMQQSRFASAAEGLKPLAEGGCDPRASLLLAAAFEGNGDADAARRTLQEAHDRWPADNSISASLARQYMADKQVKKAAQALAQFHPTTTTPLQELELATMVLLADRQLVAARAVAQTAYRAAPSVKTLLLLANTMQLEGRFKDVVSLLNASRRQYGTDPAFLITLAESEYDSILYSAAREDLARALSLDPGSYQAHFLLGNTLVKLDRDQDAIAEYRQSIALAPDQPRTHYQLALALAAMQDAPAAQQELEKALEIDSHYAPALIELSKRLIAQNRAQEAVSRLSLAIDDNPHSEQAYFLLARAYAQLGDKARSDEMARRLTAVRNSNSQIKNQNEDHRP